jgi:hypothetical protein
MIRIRLLPGFFVHAGLCFASAITKDFETKIAIRSATGRERRPDCEQNEGE